MDKIFNELKNQTTPNTKAIFYIGHLEDINDDIQQALDYIFDYQFSTLFTDEKRKNDPILVVNHSFNSNLYLSTIYSTDKKEVEQQVKTILPLLKLEKDSNVILLHKKEESKLPLDKIFKDITIKSITF